MFLNVNFFITSIVAWLCLIPCSANGQNDSIGQSFALDSVMVVGKRYTSSLKKNVDGSLVLDMDMMNYLPKILGNADPMHYAQMLPGVQTNNEFRGGINIQGCENSQNEIRINGVPVYNVNHLLGFFSTFNASHFTNMRLIKAPRTSSFSNRIGGELDVENDYNQINKINGEFSVGLMSSQGTLRTSLGRRTSLLLSGRVSYLNLLYSKWLSSDDSQIRYFFYDANATLISQINDRNKLVVDLYTGADKGAFGENAYNSDISDDWGNTLGAIHWIYAWKDLSVKSSIYTTFYNNALRLEMQSLNYCLPSSIWDLGGKTKIRWKRITAGIDYAYHNIVPQDIEFESGFKVQNVGQKKSNSHEFSVYADYLQPIVRNLSLNVGLRGTLYKECLSQLRLAADPSVSVNYDASIFRLTGSYAIRHQFIYQTGFSDMGLPTEFWISCNDRRKPQYAHVFSLEGSTYLFKRMLMLSVDLFYRKLYNQVSYFGSVLDYTNKEYNIENFLVSGRGENYGVSVILHKYTGKVTGWVSYTYSRASRSFPQRSGRKYPASHERPHEANMVVTYSPTKHWDFGLTFVYASGTPFTAPVSVSFLNSNIITEYGDYNSSRLKPYLRLDLSANYKWKTKSGIEHGINLSLYNTTYSSNEFFYFIDINRDNQFAYRPVSFFLRVLPSISYFCKI